jgi:hypothetical protein
MYEMVEERVEDMFHTVDVNNDGKISRTEFLWAMTGSSDFLPRESRVAKHRSSFSASVDHPPPFLAVTPKRAASTSNMSSKARSTSGRSTSPMESDSSKKLREASSPPNFIGILARNQAHQIETAPKVSLLYL